MGQRHKRSELHEHIVSIMDETGEEDPFEAARVKARAVVTSFHQAFGETPPLNMKAVASLRGLHWSDDAEKLQDVTERLCDHIASVYQENSPERIYFMMLYNIFNEFLTSPKICIPSGDS